MGKIKVFLVDDDPEWLATMEVLLGNFPDLTLVGTATTRNEAVKMAQSLAIDVILRMLVWPKPVMMEFMPLPKLARNKQ